MDTPGQSNAQRLATTTRFDDPKFEMFKNELLDLLNAQMIPAVVGPGQALPEGLQVGQPVITWTQSASTIKVWNGEELI